MQGQIDLVGILDAFLHGLGLPPGLVLLLVVQICQVVARELARLAIVTGPDEEKAALLSARYNRSL